MKTGVLTSAFVVVIWAAPAFGQTAGMLSFQGLIKDSNGDPINTPVDLKFRIFDDETKGDPDPARKAKSGGQVEQDSPLGRCSDGRTLG